MNGLLSAGLAACADYEQSKHNERPQRDGASVTLLPTLHCGGEPQRRNEQLRILLVERWHDRLDGLREKLTLRCTEPAPQLKGLELLVGDKFACEFFNGGPRIGLELRVMPPTSVNGAPRRSTRPKDPLVQEIRELLLARRSHSETEASRTIAVGFGTPPTPSDASGLCSA